MIPPAPKGRAKAIPFEQECEHPREKRYIRILEVNVNCETTVTACRACGTDITKPETDCR